MAEVQIKKIQSGADEDTLVILSQPNGSQAWISSRAASIEQLILPAANGDLVRHVFGHADAVEYKTSGKRLDGMPEYSEDLHRKIAESMRLPSTLMSGGVPVTFLPGRLKGGQIWFEQETGKYAKFAVPNSHPQFESLLHLGDAKTDYYDIEGSSAGNDLASVLMCQVVGKSLVGHGFPAGIYAVVKYELSDNTLTRTVKLENGSEVIVTMPTSDHGSYSPDNGALQDLSVRIPTIGDYELANGTRIANGRLDNSDLLFQYSTMSPMENMLRVMKGRNIEILNNITNRGLFITPDPESEVVYIWTHNTGNEKFQHQFISAQPYSGGITAGISAPSHMKAEELEKMHETFRQTPHQINLAKNREYVTKWSTLDNRK